MTAANRKLRFLDDVRAAVEHGEITAQDAGIALIWCDFGDSTTGENVRVTLEHLAEKCRLSEPTLKRARARLVAAGLFTLVREGGRGWASVYRYQRRPFEDVPADAWEEDQEHGSPVISVGEQGSQQGSQQGSPVIHHPAHPADPVEHGPSADGLTAASSLRADATRPPSNWSRHTARQAVITLWDRIKDSGPDWPASHSLGGLAIPCDWSNYDVLVALTEAILTSPRVTDPAALLSKAVTDNDRKRDKAAATKKTLAALWAQYADACPLVTPCAGCDWQPSLCTCEVTV